jgi:hypothetical protein
MTEPRPMQPTPCQQWQGGGGSSSSSSSTATTTTNVDKRQVVDGGVGVSSDQSTVNVATYNLDGGAIAAAMDLSKSGLDGIGKSFSEVLGFAGQVLSLTKQQQQLVTDAQSSVGDAYKTAQEISSGQRMLVAGGLIIAGVVAVSVFNKKG